MSTFNGFSEEDLKRIKSGETTHNGRRNDHNKSDANPTKKIILPSLRTKAYPNKTINLQNQKIEDAIDDLKFDKCRLSIKPPAKNDEIKAENVINNESTDKSEPNDIENVITIEYNKENEIQNNNVRNIENENNNVHQTPEIVRGVNFAEDDLSLHRDKLVELQLKQRLMEEQNKKRKEMLGRALADRTRQTEEEVMKLEKIKKELQVLDGQFSQDVGVLRKKIDLACWTYSEAEKHYIKLEKEFLQAKIQLQKEKEKKELLTEHLCALITHNETRKAHKLETLMLELSSDKTAVELGSANVVPKVNAKDDSLVLDGVDQRTGKMVEFNGAS